MNPQDRRSPRTRRSDRRTVIADLLAIACMIAFGTIGWQEIRRISRDERRISRAATQRVSDLRAGCLLTSRRTAADVNLNWIYYLSERQLAGSNTGLTVKTLAKLSPPARQLLTVLAGAGQPSRHILMARAQADYHAAYVKAQTIDYHDAHLVAVRTPLGSGQLPREWVIRAHFSCTKEYPR